MSRIRVVREIVISLRIGVANALNFCLCEAKGLATDGRSVREWDCVPAKAGVTGTNVEQQFAHNDKKCSAEMVRQWGSILLGNLSSF
jgi:hypothetical protein